MTYWMWVKRKREVSSTFLAQASGWVASPINQNRDYRRRCIFWWQDAGGDDKMFILGEWIMRVEICIRSTIATSSQLKIQNWEWYRKTWQWWELWAMLRIPGKWWLSKRNLTRRKMALEMEKGNQASEMSLKQRYKEIKEKTKQSC